jgi:hypothetical protein
VIEFRLFRFVVEKSIFSPNTQPSQVLSIVVKSKPRSRFLSNKVDAEWIVSNVDDINFEAIKFFLGRRLEIELSQLDGQGDIVNRAENDIPHSRIFLHLPTGLGAIELNSEVASTSLAISKRIEILLNGSGVAQELRLRINVRPVRVATDFTRRLSEAFRLLFIEATYSKPNPPDSFRLVQQPVQNYLADLDGNSAKVKFAGENLQREPAVDLATSAIRTGNIVKAKIQSSSETPVETITSFEEEIAKFYIEEELLLGEEGDVLVVNQMRETLDISAPVGGIVNANQDQGNQQPQGNV